MIIRVKNSCLDRRVKKSLKAWGIQITRDWFNWGTSFLYLPSELTLVKSSIGYYFINTCSGRNLGHVCDPFEEDGGLLTFAP